MSIKEDHNLAQQRVSDRWYQETRSYWFSPDPMTRYIALWRLKSAIKCLQTNAGTRFGNDAKVLFLCAGDGAEASLMCDELGFQDVTFSDISPVAVATGKARDSRLKGIVANAENTNLADNSYDVVIVQDGLHHLQSPVHGFTEMLRIAKVGAIFIEPHDAWDRMGNEGRRCQLCVPLVQETGRAGCLKLSWTRQFPQFQLFVLASQPGF